jgi:hypothetical protein
MKEIKKKEEFEKLQSQPNNDMLGSLFVEKKHISYEKRAINDKQVELIKDKIVGD